MPQQILIFIKTFSKFTKRIGKNIEEHLITERKTKRDSQLEEH